MNTKQQHRLLIVLTIIALLAGALSFILYALKQNIDLFYTPTELLQTHITAQQEIRLGGFVKAHSVHFDLSGQVVNFIVTDNAHDFPVNYGGILPSLFKEGQGVVIQGKLSNKHIFMADQVLAKHDEKYMPSSLAKQLAGEQHDTRVR